jgi:hypothetical protein
MVSDPAWKYEGDQYYDMNVICPFCGNETGEGCKECDGMGERTVDAKEWQRLTKPGDDVIDVWRKYFNGKY